MIGRCRRDRFPPSARRFARRPRSCVQPLTGSPGGFGTGPSAVALATWHAGTPGHPATRILDVATGAVLHDKPRPEAMGLNPRIVALEHGFALWKFAGTLVCETMGGEVVWELPVPNTDHHSWFSAVCVDGRLTMRIGNRVYVYT